MKYGSHTNCNRYREIRMKEFDITLRVRIAVEDMDAADITADLIVDDLKRAGEVYIDRPINEAAWDLISPAVDGGF